MPNSPCTFPCPSYSNATELSGSRKTTRPIHFPAALYTSTYGIVICSLCSATFTSLSEVPSKSPAATTA